MHTQPFDICPPAHSCHCFYSAHCTDNWRMRIREEKSILVCSERFSKAPHVQVNFLKRVPQIKVLTEQEKKGHLTCPMSHRVETRLGHAEVSRWHRRSWAHRLQQFPPHKVGAHKPQSPAYCFSLHHTLFQ